MLINTPHARLERATRQALTLIGKEGEDAGAGDDDDKNLDRGDDFKPTGEPGDDPAGKTADELSEDDDKGGDKPDGEEEEGEEEEGEETEEERAEREAAEAEEAKNRRIRVPKARLDEVVTKARQREQQLVERIRELERKDSDTPQKDVLGEMRTAINELQDKYEAHVFAGEKDEAKQVRAQLEDAREKYTDAKAAATSEATRLQTIDSLRYDAALAKAEADYPALNPDNEGSYDEAKANEVATLMGMFTQNGLTRQASLEKAVRYVMGPPATKRTDTAADTLGKRQAQQAREKAAAAARRQPPADAGAGTDNDKAGGERQQGINVMRLSQEKFAELDEATLATMRGDEVT